MDDFDIPGVTSGYIPWIHGQFQSSSYCKPQVVKPGKRKESQSGGGIPLRPVLLIKIVMK